MASKNKYRTELKMPSLDNLFSTEAQRQDASKEKIEEIRLSELHPFENHPFEVRNDSEMEDMIASIKTYGVMTPIIARPREAGGYEIISGHRRAFAADKAGVDAVPVIIREMDTDQAIIAMVDANLQREHIRTMEKAKAYKMKLEAMKRQGQRTDLTSSQFETKLRSDEIMAQEAGESRATVQRHIRLLELIPELQEMVDADKLKMNPAYEISFMNPDEQKEFYDYITLQDVTPSLSMAQKLKKASKDGVLNEEKMDEIMTTKPQSVMAREMQLSLDVSRLQKYFPKGYTKAQMESQIMHILESYFRQVEHNRNKAIER